MTACYQLVLLVCMLNVQGRYSESLVRYFTATPTKPIYELILDSPEQYLPCGVERGTVSLVIHLEPLRSQAEFE